MKSKGINSLEIKSEVGFGEKIKVGKGVSKGKTRKIWIPKMKMSIQYQVKEILSWDVEIFERVS